MNKNHSVFFSVSLDSIGGFLFFFMHNRQIFIIEIRQRENACAFSVIDFVVLIDSRESDFSICFYNRECFFIYILALNH